ncbi:hypothetical protein DPMN_191570 [Dreissena polymorpha]|uniref:Uncharacterized protein n=1 Tax=Dreissena polymorpha TaxID=45954 RepID=A0A9D3Y5F1_DREPO|nr:hypothetical protein DPMN_191570 [Dreissena polymorpha]
MYETRTTEQAVAEMKKFKFTILGISEPRWTGCGYKRLTYGDTLLLTEHKYAARIMD